MKRKCAWCKVEKDLEEFYRNKSHSQGRIYQCKPCWNAYIAKKQKGRQRKYRTSAEYRKWFREYVRKWNARNEEKRYQFSRKWVLANVEKVKAQRAVHRAVKKGILKRKGCEKCGMKADAHHPDYSKPLEVRWLCRLHHREEHKLLNS